MHDSASSRDWILSAALLLPVLLRRHAPLLALSLMLGAAVVQLAFQARLPADLAVLVVLFTIANRLPRSTALKAAALMEAFGVVAAFRAGPSNDGRLPSLLFGSGLVAAAYFAGSSLQERRAYLSSVLDRAQRLEAEQAQNARLAVTQERTRIAREMHDIIAHSLTVMITLAEAARSASPAKHGPADLAMQQVAATGREAMDEMRRLLSVLRDDATTTPPGPQPGLPQLHELVESTRVAGLPVHFTITGAPRAASAAMETTIYRVVQEALTNALRHANKPKQVSVSLTSTPEALLISIEDDGQPARPGTPSTALARRGHGIIGMRERVAVFGGELQAGPEKTGWLVQAHFPLPPGSTL
ncbi:MAG: histidine kinase [Actinomycetota bacterium]|nr:histidine kinase [Actinomycetota bacterium]